MEYQLRTSLLPPGELFQMSAVEQVFANRGIMPNVLERYIDADLDINMLDPASIKNMEEGVKLLI